jgi:hypothetical protein
MKKYSAFIMPAVLLFAISCSATQAEPAEAPALDSTTGSESEAELATGAEDIAGMWTRDLEGSATSFYFKEDGTFNLLFSTDPEKLENSPGLIGEYWFEGSQLFVTDVEQFIATSMGMCPDVGVYEVVMLETGNIMFRVVEDECAGRIDTLVGPGFVDIEYMPLR